MTPEQKVCNLELSKKLKGLGVNQDSLCWWKANIPHKSCSGHSLVNKEPITWISTDDEICAGRWELSPYGFSAFTVAELGELLPEKRYDDDMWRQVWEWEENGFSEADARAKMLIFLIEQGLVTP